MALWHILIKLQRGKSGKTINEVVVKEAGIAVTLSNISIENQAIPAEFSVSVSRARIFTTLPIILCFSSG